VSSSFTRDIPAFNPDWRDQYDKLSHDRNDYAGFRATLIRQIVDLREMDDNSTLKNEQRYFGMSAPRKSYWYNFDPIGYLECAMAGSFGGWEPGDETGRQFVPEPVALLLTVHAIFCIAKWYPITGCMVFQPRQSVIHPGG